MTTLEEQLNKVEFDTQIGKALFLLKIQTEMLSRIIEILADSNESATKRHNTSI